MLCCPTTTNMSVFNNVHAFFLLLFFLLPSLETVATTYVYITHMANTEDIAEF